MFEDLGGKQSLVFWFITTILIGFIATSYGNENPPSSCEIDDKELILEPGDWIPIDGILIREVMTYWDGFEGCCGDLTVEDDEEQEYCRMIGTEEGFCDFIQANEDECPHDGPTEMEQCNHTMTINLFPIKTNSDASCCLDCTCFGDPNCIAFDGSRDIWAICDARNTYLDDNGRVKCHQKRRGCLKQYDHKGNQCLWMPDHEDRWRGPQDGTRCQPNWGLSGHPTMTMYDADDFSVVLTLGDLGVIDRVDLIDKDSSFYITSELCFEYDPRDTPDIENAWTPNTIPDDWNATYSTINPDNPEILWKVNNARTGVFLDIICTKVNDVPRINIQHLLETDYDREGEGFCFTGEISSKAGSTEKTNLIHDTCVSAFVSDNVEVCKALMGPQCNPSNYLDHVINWCNDADFTNMVGAMSVNSCVSTLTSDVDNEQDAIGITWTRMVCQANQLDETICMTQIEEDGWEIFLRDYSDGLITSGNPQQTCAQTIEQYTDEYDECDKGYKVEYLEDGEWIVSFFIPESFPPCHGKLDVPVTDRYANLYLYPVRFTQCGLSAECLVHEKACSPTMGYNVSLSFQQSCEPYIPPPTPQPTQPFLRSCPCTEGDLDQTICDSNDGDFTQLGECTSCCSNEDFKEDFEEDMCRMLETQVPYCDVSDEQNLCEQLVSPEGDGLLTLKFVPDGKQDDLVCCADCQCWGDPQCRSFDGTHDVWLICESRDDTCELPIQSECLNNVDHVGRQCKWDQDKYNRIERRRGDIAAFGSPCQPNWEESGDASMTMYTIDDFGAFLTMGERGVIETLLVKQNENNQYTLGANECFEFENDQDFLDPWKIIGEDPNIDENSIQITYHSNTPTERVYHVYDPISEIFIQVACLRRGSHNNQQFGYRLNVENLIDTVYNRTKDGDGFCVTGEIDTLESTVDEELFNTCHEGSVGVTEMCQNLWSETCTKKSDIDRAVQSWCENAYGISNTEPIHDCVQHILHDIIEDNIMTRWAQTYCSVIGNDQRSEQLTASEFVEQCESNIRLNGIENMVQQYGTGVLSNPVCARSPSEYTTRENDECYSGMAVEYFNSLGSNIDGEWIELFFIPDDFPPCEGELLLTAQDYPQVFQYPFRIKQCFEREQCSLTKKCSVVQGYDITYQFTHSLTCP